MALRIPGWAKRFELRVNGEPACADVKNGYAIIRREWKTGDAIVLDMPLDVRFMQAHPAVHDDCGRVAVMRGPLVYCLEEADNGKYLKDIRIASGAKAELSHDSALGATVIDLPATRVWPEPAPLYMDYSAMRRENITARFIPFYTWANREEGEMLVWTDIDD